MTYGNKDKTEINIPLDADGILEMEVAVHVGIDERNFGEVKIHGNFDIWMQDDDCKYGLSSKFLGTAKVKVDMSDCDTDIDVRGILISKIQEQIKKENARHIKQKSYLETQLSNLTAITHNGGE